MIGQSLKNYQIDSMLGKGGMGVVYRARDIRLDRPVAVKVLPPELVGDPDRRRRFIQEAKAASQVNHPAIAQIYEIEEEGDLAFIVMEFVEGSTLSQLISKREIDLVAAVEIASQVADALGKAHEAGIVHRDIKPDNIMVTKDGHPKILDFGLAKRLDRPDSGVSGQGSLVETLAKTQAGMIVGTIAYMSPEQARGLPADRRSDVFSFGIVLYQMTTGRLPFDRQSVLDTMHAIAFEQPEAVTQIRTDVPYSLQRVVERCLQKKPEDRYQDMRQVAADLKQVRREVETGVTGGAPVFDRLQWWVSGFTPRGAIWGVVGGVALGVVATLMLLRGFGPERIFPIVLFAGVGLAMYRRFRNRTQRMMRKFVRRSSALKEVRLVTFANGQFTVFAENPSPRTYLRLNAFLEQTNSKLFRGEPMTMVVREKLDEQEERTILQSPGVQYLRDDTAGSSIFRRARGRV